MTLEYTQLFYWELYDRLLKVLLAVEVMNLCVATDCVQLVIDYIGGDVAEADLLQVTREVTRSDVSNLPAETKVETKAETTQQLYRVLTNPSIARKVTFGFVKNSVSDTQVDQMRKHPLLQPVS